MEPEKKKKLLRRLKNRYRLVIMNDETLEERASFNLRPLNVFVTAGLAIILLITITTFLIAFTALREYIPGYADLKTQRRVYNLVMKADSMERSLRARDLYITNLKSIINGEVSVEPAKMPVKNPQADTVHMVRSAADEALRQMIESQDASINLTTGQPDLNGFSFFTPLKGTITNKFDPGSKHFGLDIVADADEGIKATLDGTVVLSDFTAETGYVIGIQHANNILSLYKHNSALLKKVGDFVQAGDVVAIIGNSGELSEGPHLHFELWLNGSAVNPQRYIAF